MVLFILCQNSLRQGLKIWKNQSHQVFPQETVRQKKKGSKKTKAATFNNAENEDSDEEHEGKQFCKLHSTCRHITNKCTTQKALSSQFKKEKKYDKHEVNATVEKKVKIAPMKKKKKSSDELHAFKKMSVSDSKRKSLDSSSSEEGKI